MLKILISIFCFGLLNTCAGSTAVVSDNKETGNIQDSILQKVEKLKILHSKLSTLDREDYVQEYFETFPASFNSFNEMFGYKENSGNTVYAPLYDDAHKYIVSFFQLDIEKIKYYNKIIAISTGSKWDADAINYFQHEMREKVKNDIKDFIEVLSKRNTKEIQGFWHFYFDGPHPPETIPKELESIKQLNAQIYRLMEAALKAVQED